MAERIGWVDFAKGVAIILMVLGHAVVTSPLKKFIFVFHMPFFFVTAGFLLNLNKWGGAENFNAFAAKLFKRLLVPYYLAELLWYPIWFVVCHEAGYLKYWAWTELDSLAAFTAIFVGNGDATGLILLQLWFLPALLCAELVFIKLYNWLSKFGTKIFAAAVVTCSLFGFCVGRVSVLPFGFDIALTAQIFLLAGVLIRKYNFVERIGLKTCAVSAAVVVLAFCLNISVDMNFRQYGEPFLFYAGGLAGTLLLMKLSALMTGGKIFLLISGKQ